MEIEAGQVWSETVHPKDGGEPWERLHVVHGTKGYWLLDQKRFMVLSSGKDGSFQTDLGEFHSRFTFTGWTVNARHPCIEQRSLEELEAMETGTYQPVDAEVLQAIYDAVQAQLKSLDAVKRVGGCDRYRAVKESIEALVLVFSAAGGDAGLAKKLMTELAVLR